MSRMSRSASSAGHTKVESVEVAELAGPANEQHANEQHANEQPVADEAREAQRPERDPIPALSHEVLALYREALSELRFPDLDLAALESMRSSLEAAQCEVERVERELEAARAVVAARTEALLGRSQRALAYAKVFAQGDEALSARVAQVGARTTVTSVRDVAARRSATVVEGAVEGAPKKRGRPRKVDSDPGLFAGDGASTAASAEDAPREEESSPGSVDAERASEAEEHEGEAAA